MRLLASLYTASPDWEGTVLNTDMLYIYDCNRQCIYLMILIRRAPVLVAIAMIEYGLDPISAVTFIRERRRGAINAVQLNYLTEYKPIRKKYGVKCVIM